MPDTPPKIETGYRPGLLAEVTGLHIRYYAREFGFGRPFECKVASEMAEFLGRIDAPENQSFHAWQDGRLLGAVSMDGEDLGAGRAHLRWFVVSDAARGLGLGRDLLSAAMAHADGAGMKETRLWTFRGLDAARHLYEAFGFTLVEEQRGAQWGSEVSEQCFVRPKGGAAG